jgi:hypothetical protein
MERQFNTHSHPGFKCNDKGESVISLPTELEGEEVKLKPSNVLVIQVDSQPLTNHVWLTVNETFTVDGHLIIEYTNPRDTDAPETFRILSSDSKIRGQFKSIKGRMNPKTIVEEPATFCETFEVQHTMVAEGTEMDVAVKFFTCVENIERHPVRAVLITIGVFGTLFLLFGALISWRKRQWDKTRRSVLASKIDYDDDDALDMEMGDITRKNEGYAAAAKLIESREGRFEIGADEDDAEL